MYKYPKDREQSSVGLKSELIKDDDNDILTHQQKQLYTIFKKLKQIKQVEQGSAEWFSKRVTRITASEVGSVIGDNHYTKQYEFIINKVQNNKFETNVACYHGKQLEDIACMIYEFRENVKVDHFGFMLHDKHDFLGASPDGIVSKYKYDGIHITSKVGTMLEIKCPLQRQIHSDGEVKGHIVPLYYWDQMQLQLECCDLENCDFFQCNIKEYVNRDEFIDDTDPKVPYKSISTHNEKGCLIHLLKINDIRKSIENTFIKTIYENSVFIYPPKINMSPYECDIWISSTISNLEDIGYKNHVVYKIIYWKLINSHNVTIERDREWFETNFKQIKTMWSYVSYFKDNTNKFEEVREYISQMKNNCRYVNNNKVMKYIHNLVNNISNDTVINKTINITKKRNIANNVNVVDGNDSDDMFID
jgi:putative phage-type endonuclease